MRKPTVMVSSAIEDLILERQTVLSAIEELRCEPLCAEAQGSATPAPLSLCESWARECDVYLCILGGRYGSTTTIEGHELSITEFEYSIASQYERPILVYIKMEPPEPQQKVFQKKVMAPMSGRWVSQFRSALELAKQIGKDLERELLNAAKSEDVELEFTLVSHYWIAQRMLATESKRNEALGAWSQVFDLSQLWGDVTLEEEALQTIQGLYFKLGRIDDEIEVCEHRRNLYDSPPTQEDGPFSMDPQRENTEKKRDCDAELGELYGRRADRFEKSGKWDAAFTDYEASQEAYLRAQRSDLADRVQHEHAEARIELGKSQVKHKQLYAALRNFREATRIYGRLDAFTQYLQTNKAIREVLEKLGDIRGAIRLLEDLKGEIVARSDLDDAAKRNLLLDCLVPQRRLALSINDIREASRVTADIGKIFLDKGDYDKAEEELNRARIWLKSIHASKILSQTLHSLGQLYCKRGRRGEAIPILTEAANLARSVKDLVLDLDIRKTIEGTEREINEMSIN